MLEHHHDGEEDILFPLLEAASGNAGTMQTNIQQHVAFHSGLVDLQAYLASVQADSSATSYDGPKLKQLIDAFAPALVQHLYEEIPTLLQYGKSHPDADVQTVSATFQSQVKRHKQPGMYRGMTEIIPFMTSCHDDSFDGGRWKEGYPPPFRVMASVAKWVLYRPNRDAWKFAPCSFELALKPDM